MNAWVHDCRAAGGDGILEGWDLKIGVMGYWGPESVAYICDI
jgi:hypothetical protein